MIPIIESPVTKEEKFELLQHVEVSMMTSSTRDVRSHGLCIEAYLFCASPAIRVGEFHQALYRWFLKALFAAFMPDYEPRWHGPGNPYIWETDSNEQRLLALGFLRAMLEEGDLE